MNGPDHYREAQRLMDRAEICAPEQASQHLAEAQVHATLALAAATIHGSGDNGSRADSEPWWEVTGLWERRRKNQETR